jgi:lipopolysaccharide export system protein LptA
MRRINAKLVILSVGLWPLLALALASDRQHNIVIHADYGSYQHDKAQTHYHGHVQIIQGTTQLLADDVTTQNDQKGLQNITAIGKPAQITTQLDNNKQHLLAQADTILYYPQQGKVILQGHALLKQNKDSFESPRIEYDIQGQHLYSPPSSNGRTTITIQTRQNL